MVLQYIIQYIPVLLALVSELGIVKICINQIKKMKETKEYKQLIEQNRALLNELREQQKLNKELLTKIDKINRGE